MLKRLADAYCVLLALAAGGLAFANIFGVLATAFHFGGDVVPAATPVKHWMHIGWVFGVCVALVGVIVQWRKRLANEGAVEAPQESVPQVDQVSPEVGRKGFLISAAWGGFFGTLLGAALGVTFILLWFSITYSPFAPQSWVSSVSVENQRVEPSKTEVPVSVTNHPVALYAFGLPVVLGAIGGAAFGGIVRVSDDSPVDAD